MTEWNFRFWSIVAGPQVTHFSGNVRTGGDSPTILSACHPEPQAKDLQLFFITSHSAVSAYDPCMHEGSYCTYMMASRSRTLCVGATGDPLKRVFQHKWKEHEGFTARYNCDRLIWFERHQDVQRAIAREKELKRWRRARKIALIESANPT